MSRYNADELYRLLPAIYRARDAETGGQLQALIRILAEQAAVMEDDISRLYENWFIETCDEWVVPYIGDLVGVRGLHQLPGTSAFSQRARVANTLAYRCRKGTATMLEQLARDTTGWNARAVEYFEILDTTQHFNHVRLSNHRTADLRQAGKLELLDTPFDTIAHTADVRHIARGGGRHNVPNVGLHLWRLQSYAVAESDVRAVGNPAERRFAFDPLGGFWPLFNRPQTETEITQLAREVNVPAPLRRRPLYEELEELRQSAVDGRSAAAAAAYFGGTPPFRLWKQAVANGSIQEITADKIAIADLRDFAGGWVLPATPKDYVPSGTPLGTSPVSLDLEAAVDPELGRIALLTGQPPHRLRVSYAYGFSGDLGAGTYNRRESLDAILTRGVDWQRGVTQQELPVANETFNRLAAAVQAWNAFSSANPGQVGAIAVLDNATYVEDLTGASAIQIPDGSLLLIVAADWPRMPVPGGMPGQKQRLPGNLEPDNRRPHLLGEIEVCGLAPKSSPTPGQCVLNGMLIEGSVTVKGTYKETKETVPAHLGELRLDHCTVVPPAHGLKVEGGNGQLAVRLYRTICGAVSLPASCPRLEVRESIVDAGARLSVPTAAITALGAAADIQGSTLFGTVSVQSIEAENCLFTAPVTATRCQEGCVRFSYVPPGGGGKYATPRRFRCQPELAQAGFPVAAHEDIARRLTPVFNGLQFGAPAYGQLSASAALELREGADDGSEMGAFSFLKQPQRLANLNASLPEFLRFGLEAGVLLET
jgi:hypothetical protein